MSDYAIECEEREGMVIKRSVVDRKDPGRGEILMVLVYHKPFMLSP